MATIVGPDSQDHHPAPSRRRESLISLLFGLFAAPVAWSVALIVSYALAAEACFPNDRPLRSPASYLAADRPVIIVINLAALLIAGVAAVAAYRNWRRTQGEKADDHAELMDIGEGRSRFMALSGIMTSVGFSAVILVNLIAAISVPQCSG